MFLNLLFTPKGRENAIICRKSYFFFVFPACAHLLIIFKCNHLPFCFTPFQTDTRGKGLTVNIAECVKVWNVWLRGRWKIVFLLVVMWDVECWRHQWTVCSSLMHAMFTDWLYKPYCFGVCILPVTYRPTKNVYLGETQKRPTTYELKSVLTTISALNSGKSIRSCKSRVVVIFPTVILGWVVEVIVTPKWHHERSEKYCKM